MRASGFKAKKLAKRDVVHCHHGDSRHARVTCLRANVSLACSYDWMH